jgi:hypothetical protein
MRPFNCLAQPNKNFAQLYNGFAQLYNFSTKVNNGMAVCCNGSMQPFNGLAFFHKVLATGSTAVAVVCKRRMSKALKR